MRYYLGNAVKTRCLFEAALRGREAGHFFIDRRRLWRRPAGTDLSAAHCAYQSLRTLQAHQRMDAGGCRAGPWPVLCGAALRQRLPAPIRRAARARPGGWPTHPRLKVASEAASGVRFGCLKKRFWHGSTPRAMVPASADYVQCHGSRSAPSVAALDHLRGSGKNLTLTLQLRPRLSAQAGAWRWRSGSLGWTSPSKPLPSPCRDPRLVACMWIASAHRS